MDKSAILVLEDGSVFKGRSIGAEGVTTGELVFNTSITGYQEILSDPSYAEQLITFTHPHIGNVGVNQTDNESDKVWAKGMVVRDMSATYSNYRAEHTLQDWLIEKRIVAISDVDTRALTVLLREKGALRACIVTDGSLTVEKALEKAKASQGLKGLDLAKVVTTEKVYNFEKPSWKNEPPETKPYHVVVLDFGVKQNILRLLVDKGCKLTVVPATTDANTILSYNPDGVFLSNGPGDPEPCSYAIETIRTLLDNNTPLFGICLGHQLLALSLNAKTVKMKFGHHGGNHPVKHVKTNTVAITSQNHGFAVSDEKVPEEIDVTHISLFDRTIQGIRHKYKPAFSFQGHPEASPGPHDLHGVFQEFINLMAEFKEELPGQQSKQAVSEEN